MKNRALVVETADALAVFTAFGSLLQYLPEAAALLAIIWTLIRIYEWARVRLWGKSKTWEDI